MNSKIYAQSSVEITGAAANSFNTQFHLGGLERSISELSSIRDWEFSASYSTEFGKETSGNLYLISLSKKLGPHNFFLRYTPGYQKDFLLGTGYSVITYDSIPINLKSKTSYEEKFGLGYSFRITDKITAGVGFRYFREEFTDDQVIPLYTDTLTTITTSTDKRLYNRWRGDIGFNYRLFDNLILHLSTVNLIANDQLSDNGDLMMKTDKTLLGGMDLQFSKFLKAKVNYETNNSFSLGLNLGFGLSDASLSFSAEMFHDRYQQPFIAGIIPAVNYSTRHFSVIFSGIKYFEDRTREFSVNEFTSGGIHNITNNRFSTDRAAITVNFALNTSREQLIKFEDIRIEQNIFPALTENYIDVPFATAKVINLSQKPVKVLPSSRISGVTRDKIQSPPVSIQPMDTSEVKFYTLLDNVNFRSRHAEIAQADFFISVDFDEIQDEMYKPILIQDINSWDGLINNLRYFVKRDFDFSNRQARSILSFYKNSLDTIPQELSAFYIIKYLYTDFISNMIYVADPRSSADRVQFPSETFTLKGGDCDDLSVAFSSLLESVGIQTAFIDYVSDSSINHVNLLVNTQLSPEMAEHITINEKKYTIRKNAFGKDEIWIPVETTTLKSFSEAWEKGADLFYTDAIQNYGLIKGNVRIIDVY